MSEQPWISPAASPLWLRPLLWLAERIAGAELAPARFLAMKPKLAIGAAALELSAASAPRDLEPRTLATVRLVTSLTVGCPFCVDMNAATWRRAQLERADLEAILSMEPERWRALGEREALAARYAQALSRTPVSLDEALRVQLKDTFTPAELVTLATTIAQVNFWSRYGQGLDIKALGLAQAAGCPVELP